MFWIQISEDIYSQVHLAGSRGLFKDAEFQEFCVKTTLFRLRMNVWMETNEQTIGLEANQSWGGVQVWSPSGFDVTQP